MTLDRNDARWPEAAVVILASGESLDAEQCALVHAWREADRGQRKVVVINTTFRLAPWANLLYACDYQWWQVYAGEAQAAFVGERWTQDERARDQFKLNWIRSEPKPGLSRSGGVIHQGRNGGYQAINLAYLLGAERIILLGYDMGGGHHHGEHPPGVRRASNFGDWIPLFEPLARDLEREGVQVINATPGSALTAFDQLPLNVVLMCERSELQQQQSARGESRACLPS